ncbi:MAG: 23S rRNA (cytidine(2498)-2'-O)-methyltransferase RlmM [Thiotrichales bacterium]
MRANLPTEYPALGLIFLCRPGFEPECAAETQAVFADCGVAGYCKTHATDGYGVFHATDPGRIGSATAQLDPRTLTFVRQGIWLTRIVTDLPERDRLSVILQHLPPGPFGALWLETPDTNDGKAVQTFCRQFAPHLERALRQSGTLNDGNPTLPRLHIVFPNSRTAYLGITDPARTWPWPGGVPRLKMPREAPSRSTLKLDEAIQTFLTAEQRQRWLRPGLTAVDLGAAPGGWSWQLVRRGLHVTAIDNGPMAPALLATGQVEQRREDGFRYRPPRRVDWLVCDMVEQPQRIASLIAAWLARGDCRHAIFNLKLPMKKRHAMVQDCAALIRTELERNAVAYTLKLRQLYHDREEVTGFASIDTRI